LSHTGKAITVRHRKIGEKSNLTHGVSRAAGGYYVGLLWKEILRVGDYSRVSNTSRNTAKETPFFCPILNRSGTATVVALIEPSGVYCSA
jgi:hypothetical protein